MIYPFNKKYPVTSTFEQHCLSGGVRSQVPAVDYGTPVGTPIYAMFDCFIQLEKESFQVDGTWYTNTILAQVSDTDGQRVDIRHVSEVMHDHEHVKEGELVGYTGEEGYCFGPHACVAYRPNWNTDHADAYIDIDPILESLKTSDTSVQPHSGSYIIQPGDNLTSISARTGVSVDNLVAWNNIANPDLIYAGEVLKLTAPVAIPAPAVTEELQPQEPSHIDTHIEHQKHLDKEITNYVMNRYFDSTDNSTAVREVFNELKPFQSMLLDLGGRLTSRKFLLAVVVIGTVVLNATQHWGLTNEDILMIVATAGTYIGVEGAKDLKLAQQ